MGCSESKSSVATGNTITQSKKLSAVGAAQVDEPEKVESAEKVIVPLEDKASEGDANVKEMTRDAEIASEVEKKDDASKEDEKEKPEKADEYVKEEKAVEKKKPEKANGLSFPSSVLVLNASDFRQDPMLRGEFPVRNAGAKEVANNEEGSIKEVEPGHATPSPMVAETAGAIVSEESNPPSVSFHVASSRILESGVRFMLRSRMTFGSAEISRLEKNVENILLVSKLSKSTPQINNNSIKSISQ